MRSKIKWHPVPKIVHLPHFATICDKMEQLKLQTLQMCPACGCVCVHVHFDWTMTQKKKYVVNMLEQRLMHYKTCPMASLWELWINQRLRVLAKEAIKYDFLNVPLRLNTSLRWTIWLIPRVFNVSRFRCNAMTHVLALSATVRRNERLWRNLDIGKIIGATFGFQNS